MDRLPRCPYKTPASWAAPMGVGQLPGGLPKLCLSPLWALPAPACWSHPFTPQWGPRGAGGCYPCPHPPTHTYTQACAHQGDEVGEGELQADVDHVQIVLGGPQVGVVALHQVPEQTLLLVTGLSPWSRQW